MIQKDFDELLFGEWQYIMQQIFLHIVPILVQIESSMSTIIAY